MPFFRNIVRMLIKSIYLGYFTTKSGRSSQRPLHFSTGKQFKFNLYNIYILCLSVCPFWCLLFCLYPINVNTAEQLGPILLSDLTWPHQGRMDAQNYKNLSPKFLNFVKFENPRKKLKIRRICFLAVPWRKC